MPKYWGKQIFIHGRFPEVGQKQKTEREKERERKKRLNDGDQWPSYTWRTQARMALASRLGQKGSLFQEQTRRKLRKEEVCQDHASQLYYEDVPLWDIDWDYTWIIYIPQYNLLYCGVPKAGISTWTIGRDQQYFKLLIQVVAAYS